MLTSKTVYNGQICNCPLKQEKGQQPYLTVTVYTQLQIINMDGTGQEAKLYMRLSSMNLPRLGLHGICTPAESQQPHCTSWRHVPLSGRFRAFAPLRSP